MSYQAGHRLSERGQDADELMILKEGVFEFCFPVHIARVFRQLTLEGKQTGDGVA